MVFACPASSPSTRMDLFSIVVSTVASQHESPTLQSILRCFCMQSACSLCILWFPPTVQKHAWTDHRCEYSSVSPRQPCDRWVTCSPYDIWIVCKHRKQDVSAGLGLSSPEAQRALGHGDASVTYAQHRTFTFLHNSSTSGTNSVWICVKRKIMTDVGAQEWKRENKQPYLQSLYETLHWAS